MTALALGTSFVAAYLLVRRDEWIGFDRALLEGASAAAELAALRDTDSVVKTYSLPPIVPSPDARFVAVYGSAGEIVAATHNFPSPPRKLANAHAPDPLVPFDLNGRPGRLRGVVMPVGVRDEQVLFAMSRDSFEEDLDFLAKVLVFLFFSATGATALVARWLGASLSGDVDAIAAVARTVARGKLSARVGTGRRGSDETTALGADLDHMIAQLDELVSTQQRFISHAAHELRSPLATLRGELQLALRRPRQLNEYRETIEESLEEVTALCSLAEDLLTLARVQHRQHQADANASLNDIIADAVRLTVGPAEDRGVRLLVPKVDESLLVVGVRSDLTRAVRNLIDNAIAHSPHGAEVHISVDVDEGRVVLAVADSGPGVSLEDASAIFSPFFRSARNQSSDTGAGLGLSITREIARAYGGDVVLDEKYRSGAKFLLALVPA